MKSLLEQFKSKNILVFGDVMLDRYWSGDVERISPEAPVPVLSLVSERLVAGGGANVAANAAGLGAKVTLLSMIGEDDDGIALRDVVGSIEGVESKLIASKSRKTTVKSRVMAGHQQIVRVDSEDAADLNGDDVSRVCGAIDKALAGAEAVIVSDYGKGVVTRAAVGYLIKEAVKLEIPVLVDPKGVDYEKYRGASVVTPNKKEALDVFRLNSPHDNDVLKAGSFIQNEFGIGNVVVTLGSEGMALFYGQERPTILHASARNVFDVTGAGDTVIAVLSLAIACGAGLFDGAKLANVAAGKVVETVGTTAISFDALIETLDEHGSTEPPGL